MAKLLVQESGGEPREFELVDAEVHIGRELDNALRLADPSISRHHCVLRRTASGFEIQDLQSSNGVLVNGNRMPTAVLKDGDRITLGQIQMTFVNPPEVGATVAITAIGGGENPLGTVRMTADQMAAIHSGAPAPEKPVDVSTDPIQANPNPPAPAPKPAAAPAPAAAAAPQPPSFGHFTDPGALPQGGAPAAAPASGPSAPAAGFLGRWLPPVPDDARPTGASAELGDRIMAHLIDIAPVIALAIVIWVIAIVSIFIPFLGCLGCILWLGFIVAALAYEFYLLPQCLVKHRATPGKRRMKLRVVPEENPEGSLDFGRAILHQFGSYFGLIQLIVVAANNGKGLSNIFAKSHVIKVDK